MYISAKNVSGHSTTSINLSPDGKSTAVCERFEVMDLDHKLLFFVDSDQIGFKLEHLRILGKFMRNFLNYLILKMMVAQFLKVLFKQHQFNQNRMFPFDLNHRQEIWTLMPDKT